MKKIIVFLFLYVSISALAQKGNLADTYFKKGDYEKAIMLYKNMHAENPIRQDYFKKLLTSYQQLEQYDSAKNLITNQLNRYPRQEGMLLVELGYNYQLTQEQNKATLYYNKALEIVMKNPSYGYLIGQTFRKNHLLDEALEAYSIAKKQNPKLNTEIIEAQIYGEKGDLEQMFNAYFNLINKNEKYYSSIQRYLAYYITSDYNNSTNILFKKLLLKRAQNNPKDVWNKLLSWLYMQQNEYQKAFIQEKSLYRRNPENLMRIQDIGNICLKNKVYDTAQDIFQFIKDHSADQDTLLNANIILLEIDHKLAKSDQELLAIKKNYEKLLLNNTSGESEISIQLAYADFLAFHYSDTDHAIAILKSIQPLARSKFERAQIRLKLADILVFTNNFNQALILYTQVQTNLDNSILAQEARFKIAKTSYYKGDFKWAQVQLKVLKSSTSQLIANDALELSVLITNNQAKDSTQQALKWFASADLSQFQGNHQKAITQLNTLLNNFPKHPIVDDALFLQAKAYVTTEQWHLAENNYLSIIELHQDSLLLDDTYFALANLYQHYLNQPERAKEMYQNIIFSFPSSIYLVDARNNFRQLRGDEL